MNEPQTDIPVRAPAKTSADDTVQPFDVSALDLRGRVVRLRPGAGGVLPPPNYPRPGGAARPGSGRDSRASQLSPAGGETFGRGRRADGAAWLGPQDRGPLHP